MKKFLPNKEIEFISNDKIVTEEEYYKAVKENQKEITPQKNKYKENDAINGKGKLNLDLTIKDGLITEASASCFFSKGVGYYSATVVTSKNIKLKSDTNIFSVPMFKVETGGSELKKNHFTEWSLAKFNEVFKNIDTEFKYAEIHYNIKRDGQKNHKDVSREEFMKAIDDNTLRLKSKALGAAIKNSGTSFNEQNINSGLYLKNASLKVEI